MKTNQKSTQPLTYKLVTFESLLHQVDPAISAEAALRENENVGKIASQFFDSLIKQYEPLVASAQESASTTKPANATSAQGIEETKDRTKKQIESAIMGGYSNLKTVKLSDFIDEAFLEDLVLDIGVDQGAAKSDKKPLSRLMKESADRSSITLPTLQRESNSATSSVANKRRKTSAGDLQVTHLIMNPLLALILNQTEYLLNQDWRRRQIAACNLRGILNTLQRRKIDKLEYFKVQRSSEDSQLKVLECQSVPLTDLIRNVIPRLLLFILKDNFSDFAGLKV